MRFALRDRVVEGSIFGVILINKSRFIVAYSYAHRGAPGIRGRTGSGYVESKLFVARKYALKSASVPRRAARRGADAKIGASARACTQRRKKRDTCSVVACTAYARNALPRAFKRSRRLSSCVAVYRDFITFRARL